MTLLRLKRSNKARKDLDREQLQALADLYDQAYQEAKSELAYYSYMNTPTGYLQTLRLTQLTEKLQRIYRGLSQQLETQLTSDMVKVSQTVIEETAEHYASVGLKLGATQVCLRRLLRL